jgi:hypothetical protein
MNRIHNDVVILTDVEVFRKSTRDHVDEMRGETQKMTVMSSCSGFLFWWFPPLSCYERCASVLNDSVMSVTGRLVMSGHEKGRDV